MTTHPPGYVPRDEEPDEWRCPDTEPAPPPVEARPDEAILVWVDPLADEEALP